MSTLDIFADERILGNVLFYCDEKTFKSTRLVSKAWEQTSLKVIAKIAFLAIDNAYNSLNRATHGSFDKKLFSYRELTLKRFEQLISNRLTFRLIINTLRIEFAVSRQRLRQVTDELFCKNLIPSLPIFPVAEPSVFFKSSVFTDYLPKYSLTTSKESDWIEMAHLYQASNDLCKSLDSKEHSIEIHALTQLLHWIETSSEISHFEEMRQGFTTLVCNLPLNKLPSLPFLINQPQIQQLLHPHTARFILCHLKLDLLVRSSKNPDYEALASDYMESDFYLPALYSAMSIQDHLLREQKMAEIIQEIQSPNFPYWMQVKCLQFDPIDGSYALASNVFTSLLKKNLFEAVFLYLNLIHPSIKDFVIEYAFMPFFEGMGYPSECLQLLLTDLRDAENALQMSKLPRDRKAKKPFASQKLSKEISLEYSLGETVTQFLNAQSLPNKEERASAFILFFNYLIEQKPAHILAFLESSIDWKEGIESIIDLKTRDSFLLQLTVKLIRNSSMADRLSDYFAELKLMDFYLLQDQPKSIQALLKDLSSHHYLFLNSFITYLKSFPNWEAKLIAIDDLQLKEEFFERILDSQTVIDSDVTKKLQEKIDQKRISHLINAMSQNNLKRLVREIEELFSLDLKKEFYTQAFQEYKSKKNLLEELFKEMEDRNLELEKYILDDSLADALAERYSE